MAYVVARPKGRYEIRESLHTARGPRARTLANFAVLTEEVMAAAAVRATRPFDPDAVRASSARAQARARNEESGADGPGGEMASREFVAASRRMARALAGSESRVRRARRDPGATLIDLLGFADAVRASQPPRRSEPLVFPVLSKLGSSPARPALAA